MNTITTDTSMDLLLAAAQDMLRLEVRQQVRFDPPIACEEEPILVSMTDCSGRQWVFYYLDRPTKWWQRAGAAGKDIVHATRIK